MILNKKISLTLLRPPLDVLVPSTDREPVALALPRAPLLLEVPQVEAVAALAALDPSEPETSEHYILYFSFSSIYTVF